MSDSSILIIDSDNEFRKAIAAFFQSQKNVVQLSVFENAGESMASVTTHPYDMIICDYSLPDTDGISFFKRIQDIQKNAKKILFTTDPDDENIQKKASATGIHDILTKPFKREEIEKLTRMFLSIFSETVTRVTQGRRVYMEETDIHQSKTSSALKQSGKTSSEEADRVVRNHIIGAMGIGLIPIPLVDMVGLTGIQLNMLRRLAEIYHVPFCKDAGKHVIASLAGSGIPLMGAGSLASFAKIIPIVGQAMGAFAMPILSGATTYAIGKVFIQHFASGGTFLTFDPDKVREYYIQMLKEGKEVANGLKNGDNPVKKGDNQ